MMEQHEENGNGSNQISEQISSPSSQHINVLISSQTNPLQQVIIADLIKSLNILNFRIIFRHPLQLYIKQTNRQSYNNQ